MIQAALQVADRLAILISRREEPDEKTFTDVIEPMFRDAESVVYDYASLHLDLIMQIYTHDERDAIIHCLERYRLDFMPLGIQVKTLVAKAVIHHSYGHHNKSIMKFKQGILGIMQGIIRLVEEPTLPLKNYGYIGPTLIHQLYKEPQGSLLDDRSPYVDIAKKQHQAIERAWEDAVEGYAAMKFAFQAARRYETSAAFLVS